MKRRFQVQLVLLLLAALLLPACISEELQSDIQTGTALYLDVDEAPEEIVEFALMAPEITDVCDGEAGAAGEAAIDAEAVPAGAPEASAPVAALVAKSAVPTKLKLGVKEKYSLKISGAKGYKSSSRKVATVSKKGVITPKKKGKATISYTDRAGKKKKIRVTVVAAPKKVTLNKKKATLIIGDTLKLKAKLPQKTASKLKWTSSSKKVAKVDASGVVTAVGEGTAVITVKTFNKKKATCRITVTSRAADETVPPETPAPAADFTFSDNIDNTCTVTGYHGSEPSITIPDKNAQGKTVAWIGDHAFAELGNLVRVAVPSTVTGIDHHAFEYCTQLTRIDLPDSIATIGESAFSGCAALKSMAIPERVTAIEDFAFAGCSSLETVQLPSSVTTIGISAFDMCTSLTGIVIPESVSSIGNWAFSCDSSLADVTVLANDINISVTAFNECDNMVMTVNYGSDAFRYAFDYDYAYRINSESIDASWPPFEKKTYDVLVINYDPVFEIAGGKRWHELLEDGGWSDPHTLAKGFAADMNEASHGYVTYRIAEWIDVDGMPEGKNGFVNDLNEYYETLRKAISATDGSYWTYPGWTEYDDNFDYKGCLDRYHVCDRVNNGEIDEVWIFAGPCHANSMYETIMCGRNSFWCNGPNLEMDCKRFVVYGFNFERGVGCMLEDAGHRMESIMSKVFGWPDYGKDFKDYTDWEKFTAHELVSPGHAGVGVIHFPPNGTGDYDWGNKTVVLSTCDDWMNYPDLTGKKTSVNCSTWGGGDQRAYIKWWFKHIPHVAGTNAANGKFNNWWIYFTLDF